MRFKSFNLLGPALLILGLGLVGSLGPRLASATQGEAPSPPEGMVYIPAGSFQMGDNFGEGLAGERPVHTVTVSAFYMDQFQVTKALWDEVATWAAANGYDIWPRDGFGKAGNHPVDHVSWDEAVKWANARSEKEGLIPCYYTDGTQATVYRMGSVNVPIEGVKWSAFGYRLPTEAEWEKAARGGCEGHRFPWCARTQLIRARRTTTTAVKAMRRTTPTTRARRAAST